MSEKSGSSYWTHRVLIDNLGAKQPKKYSSEAFSDAMTKILASTLTGSDKRVSCEGIA